jgi:phosphoribosylaminoimidazole-succinocarboxamide synthase
MITTSTLHTLLKQAFSATDLPLPGKQIGKVRESYPLDNNRRLIITTDRFSAFDRVLNSVPYKGQVLNQLAAWWFQQTTDIVPNHVIDLPDPNALIAIETEPFPVEIIVRGYISGVTSTALWHRYAQGEREIYGYHFPEDLQKNQALPEPIITPTTKGGPTGHDERLTCAEVVEKKLLDAKTWEYMQDISLLLFKRGQALAKRAGLLLADTKYEFGRTKDGKILLIDEVHTPDSSRYWRTENYTECFASGKEPDNFDKEFIRLAYVANGYRGEGTPPTMPDALWVTLSQRFIEIYEMLTGEKFVPGEYPVMKRLERNLKSPPLEGIRGG